MTFKAIAQVLGITPKAAFLSYKRGMAKLRYNKHRTGKLKSAIKDA